MEQKRSETPVHRGRYNMDVTGDPYGNVEKARAHMRSLKKPADGNRANYTYLLACADGSFYCGWTNRLEARIEAHNAGNGAKYTKSRRPVTLVYYETFATKQEAMQREWAIKQLTRKEKLEMIRAWQPQEE